MIYMYNTNAPFLPNPPYTQTSLYYLLRTFIGIMYYLAPDPNIATNPFPQP